MDLQDRPKLFSTFMLQLLAELYAQCPEAGDLDKPRLVMFIDEAHLVFQEAGDALRQQIETIIKLIRSKGIGVFFCTQSPADIPASVLGQLGLKIQHALRAFTAADRKAIKQAAENYPETEFYETNQLITQLGIGEALVTLLNEKGIPTPLVHTLLCSPRSRMDVLEPDEVQQVLASSQLMPVYRETLDSKSAYEILNAKLADATDEAAGKSSGDLKKEGKTQKESSTLDDILDNTVVKSMMRTAGNGLVRSLLGALGLNSGSRRRR
jgi:hypothetical protein